MHALCLDGSEVLVPKADWEARLARTTKYIDFVARTEPVLEQLPPSELQRMILAVGEFMTTYDDKKLMEELEPVWSTCQLRLNSENVMDFYGMLKICFAHRLKKE